MRHVIVAIIGIVIIVVLTVFVVSQDRRSECLLSCTAEGDECAGEAQEVHSACRDAAIVCDAARTASLRKCAKRYDACRYGCDIPPF